MALADTARLVASLELEDKFSKNIDKFDRSLGRTEQKMSTLERVGFQTGRGLRNAADNLKTIGVIGGGLAVAGIIKSVNAASDLQESLSKTEVVFGSLSDEIVAWSQTSVDAFGLSQQAALETAGTFGNLFVAMGATDEASADMSTGLVELAADLASFNNLDTPEVLEKLRAGIVGEAEPLRTLGIQISAARTEAKALELGFKKVNGALTPLAKAQANYAIILEDSQKAQGDFARTSDGLANQQRILKARLDNTAATLGQALTPVIAKLAGRLDDLLVAHQDDIKAFGDALPAAFDQIIEIGENIPWETIGSSLELAGKGAQALLGAFTAMPDWVQTAVLTGWGLNKLTGGAIGSIAGALTKGAFGALRGSTPATPVFTKEVGVPSVGGAGGTPVATGGRGIGGALLGGAAKVIGVAIAAEVGREIGKSAFFDPAVAPAVRFEDSQFQQFLNNPKATQNAQVIQHNLDNVEGAIHQLIGKEEEGRIIGEVLFGEQLHKLDDQRSILQELLVNATHYASSSANRWSQEQREAYAQLNSMNRANAALNGVRNQVGVSNARLSTIAAKDFSPNVNVAFTANTSVSISEVTRAAVSNSFASGFTPRLLNG